MSTENVPAVAPSETPPPAEFNPSLLQTPLVHPRAPDHRVPYQIKRTAPPAPVGLHRENSVPRYVINKVPSQAELGERREQSPSKGQSSHDKDTRESPEDNTQGSLEALQSGAQAETEQNKLDTDLEAPRPHTDDSDSRWSFSTQYRSSQILELGQAVPMGISPDEPKEIQIQRARESIFSMNSVLSDLSAHRDRALGHQHTQSQALSTTSDSSLLPSQEPVLPLNVSQGNPVLHSADQSAHVEPQRASIQLSTPRRASGPSGAVYDGSSSSFDPERTLDRAFETGPTGQPHPLDYLPPVAPSPLHRPVPVYPFDNSSAISKTSDTYMTAREPSDEDKQEEHGLAALWTPSLPSLQRGNDDTKEEFATPRAPLESEDRRESGHVGKHRRAPSKHLARLQDLISEEKNFGGELSSGDNTSIDREHSRSIQNTPEYLKNSNRNLPDDIPARKSSKLRGLRPSLSMPIDLADSPQQQLEVANPTPVKEKGKEAGSASESRRSREQRQTSDLPSTQTVPVTHKSRREKHRHTHSAPTKHEGRRNFTKKSLQNMMETNPSQYDIEDIGLPAPERHLLEKFIDTLGKLSIEVQMDEGKRQEGRRRLNNALRALEGWI